MIKANFLLMIQLEDYYIYQKSLQFEKGKKKKSMFLQTASLV